MESLVAVVLSEGLSYAEAAQLCHVSYRTVHAHVKAIHEKTGVRSKGRLMALVRSEIWTESCRVRGRIARSVH
ncbi:MAG TPA: LuxR C-terminal-related transcriptional regulator [Thermoanaerobaculia bacterium]|jgi:DNA-binding CsgD family transcriptional regulator